MIICLFIVSISFFLDGLLSVYHTQPFLLILGFNTIFSLVSIVLIYPYLNNTKNYFYLLCGLLGIFFDITYTNTFPLNTCLFLAMGYIVEKVYSIYSNRLISGLIIATLIYLIYHILSYILLVLIGYLTFDWLLLIKNVLGTIIINAIYFTIIYQLFNYISKKYRIWHMN